MLRHRHQNVDQERGGVGIVRRHKVHLGVLEGGDEMEISAESVEFGDQQDGTGRFAFPDVYRHNFRLPRLIRRFSLCP